VQDFRKYIDMWKLGGDDFEQGKCGEKGSMFGGRRQREMDGMPQQCGSRMMRRGV